MKTLLKILVAVLAIFALSFTSNAADVEPISDKSKVVITTSEDAVMTLRLFNLDMENTEIKIKDANGDMVYFKKVKNNEDFASRINLSQLEEGTYNLYVNRSQKRFVQPLTLANGEVLAGQLVEIIKPVFTTSEDNFTVSQKGLLIQNISILDAQDQVIYSKNFGKEANQVSMFKFNLSDDMFGKYTVRVETDGEFYYNEMQVK